MADHLDPPIIRIVKKGHAHGHHGGAWKVAFADFVTAMMALFIVLWILGQSEDVKRGIGGYFRDPTGKALLGAGPAEATSNAQGLSIIKLHSLSQRYTMPDEGLENEAEKLKQLIEESEVFDGLKDQITIEVSHEGLRVEINEGENEVLFASGSAELSPKLVAALKALAVEYKKVNNKLILEGHTDAAKFVDGSETSNWELSTERANQARHVLEQAGLSDDQVLMVRGYADRRPRFGDPLDPRNRRISMLLVSDQGMDIALGRLSNFDQESDLTQSDPQSETPINPPASAPVKKKGRVSLYATGGEEN
jgi:chemotaxis protein MotB